MQRIFPRARAGGVGALVLGMTVMSVLSGVSGGAANAARPAGPQSGAKATATPIKHVVVIFQENVSFDHYFGTYPHAANTSGQGFTAARHPSTPVDGLSPALLTANPNAVNPRRLDPANINDLLTCDQDHDYTAEQKAFDRGAMDKFPQSVGTPGGTSATGHPCAAADVMNYYDGNTTTALWNYAQHFAMSDNAFGTTFGPSSPGAINLVSGNTGGVGQTIRNPGEEIVSDGHGGRTMIGDPQPFFDDCSTRDAVSMSGTNVGDLLNAAGVTWGFFQGGFRPTTAFPAKSATAPYDPLSMTAPKAACAANHPIGAAIGGVGQWGTKTDYIPHHEPFQYYATTANPHHLAPASLAAIGTDTQSMVAGAPQFDTANHQYDSSDFDALVGAIGHGIVSPDHLPAVSFLKAPGYQDGHAGYSDPLDEQTFIANEINALEHTPDWSSTAVVVAYDDSDGWYDHVFGGVHNPSASAVDALTGVGQCGTGMPLGADQGRCGFGPRLPLLVVSPFARSNFVDHTRSDQSSILKFVEDNWKLGRIAGSFDASAGSLDAMFDFHDHHRSPALFLDPTTGKSNPVATDDRD